jgi:asparagine synthase (glutamine-hydrolysing)
MLSCMVGRGPDSEGLVHGPGVTLGHRRLKIIDLSEAARQPMVDAQLGLTLAFNGCIYNYPDLRDQLEAKGYRFFSHGDTEVILKAYHAWGPACVERFNGMFAFALAERDTGRVFLARDRLGIKPIYYAQTPGRLRFASALPALLEAGDVDTAIDPVALHCYLSFHSVVPPPRTILTGIKKLPPATTMTIEPGGEVSFHEYWSPDFTRTAEEERYTEADWKHRLDHELRAAIDRRMIADVPVGCLLSGGLDSSLIVGMLAEAGQTGLNTFSIGFESVGSEAGNEFEYSDLVAERFATEHHKIQVDSQRALPNLDRAIAAMSEPMVSHDCIGFYLLSEEVSKHVKVVQSGQGADEVFAGYHWYPPLLSDDGDGLATYREQFFDRDHAEMAEVIGAAYLGDDHASAYVREHFARDGAATAIDRGLRLDTTVMLVDDPVKRVDNMTMAWGLEARVPFLDHELVELAARIPGRFKTGNLADWEKHGGKSVLKAVARDVIPHEVIDRPKGYFPVPALKYLRGPYLEQVRDTLHAPAARERGLIQPAYVQRLLADPEAHLTPLRGSKLWQVALLERWLQTHLPTA